MSKTKETKDQSALSEDKERMAGRKPGNKDNRKVTNRKSNSNKKKDHRDGKRDSEANRKGGPRNDVSWYVNSEEMKRLVANISYDYRLGHELKWNPGNVRVPSVSSKLPGILEVDWMPSYGSSSSVDSPLNIACSEVAAFIRKNIRTTIPYSPTTVGLYLMTMDSIYMRMMVLGRALVCANKYSVFNKYEPDSLVVASGYDPDTIRAHYDEYLMRYNFLVQTINTIYVPDLFKFINRHQYLCGNVFTDSDRENAQLYFPMPIGYYDVAYGIFDYDEQTEVPAAMVSKPFRRYINKFHLGTDVQDPFLYDLEQINKSVQLVKDNEDFQKIMSDMMNAYGNTNTIQLSLMTAFQVIAPVVNNEWNLQMHNAVAAGYPVFWDQQQSGNIMECTAIIETIRGEVGTLSGWFDTNYLTYKDLYHETDSSPIGIGEFDVLFDVPTQWSGDLDTVIEGTRLMYSASEIKQIGQGTPLNALRLRGVASEFVCGYSLIKGTYRTEGGLIEPEEVSFSNCLSLSAAVSQPERSRRIQLLCDLSTYTWTPLIYIYSDGDLIPIHGDISLRAKISPDLRYNINEAAIRAMFNYGNLIAGATSK